ncbi:hypothetical protein [Neobacillus massiliamazoniensis]|uniref:Uncharacterized protein n=1 Tax=Neobacillus massiliamazoniensis TaxID=1499688 RepID=A0A0U1NRM3_9BACI|nr:hypothetical protein [Neobacillus massiliamazoniensis]CRK80392.1 hypothetical protein BN000_00275 [Neobacillus massiliamazoniensis]
MDTIDRLEKRLQAVKENLKISEMDKKDIDIAFENWMVEKIQNKQNEKWKTAE